MKPEGAPSAPKPALCEFCGKRGGEYVRELGKRACADCVWGLRG